MVWIWYIFTVIQPLLHSLNFFQQNYLIYHQFHTETHMQSIILNRVISRNFFREGLWNIFVWKGKFRIRGILGFFIKNHTKLKKNPKKGRDFNPQNPSLNTPLILKIKIHWKFHHSIMQCEFSLNFQQHTVDLNFLRYEEWKKLTCVPIINENWAVNWIFITNLIDYYYQV